MGAVLTGRYQRIRETVLLRTLGATRRQLMQIQLVEYAIMAMKEHGMDNRTAIVDAAHKRARPILMTTVAMGAGRLPVALGLGEDVEFRQRQQFRRDSQMPGGLRQQFLMIGRKDDCGAVHAVRGATVTPEIA